MPAPRLWFFIQFFLIPILCLQEKHPSNISAILGSCAVLSGGQPGETGRSLVLWLCGVENNLEMAREKGRMQGVGTSPSWLGVRCEVSAEGKAGVFCGFRSKLL